MITIGYVSVSFVCGLVLMGVSAMIGSNFLIDFLRTNLLLLLPALMAINVTTAGVVMTKLGELREKYGAKFSSTITEMKHSFYEQTVLMIVAAVLLITEGAKGLDWLPDNSTEMACVKFAIGSMLCGCFIYSLIVLHDTAKSIFVMLRFEDEK